MSEVEDTAKQPSLPPPSYEEAVFGIRSTDQENGNQAFTEEPSQTPNTTLAVHYSPQQFPAIQYSSQQYTPQYYSQQYHTPNMYSMCPPGAEPLCSLSEILVYPSRGRTYKVKDQDKVTIMTIKFGWEDDCCGCCNWDNHIIYTLQSVDGNTKSARATQIMDSCTCCSYSERHLEVEAPVGTPLGTVRIQSENKCNVENQSGDIQYKLHREKSWWTENPYQIHMTDGRQVGMIDHSRGIKHRLTLPKEMSVQHKILLLFFTVNLQSEADSRRRSD